MPTLFPSTNAAAATAISAIITTAATSTVGNETEDCCEVELGGDWLVVDELVAGEPVGVGVGLEEDVLGVDNGRVRFGVALGLGAVKKGTKFTIPKA